MALLAAFRWPYPSRPGRRGRVPTADRDSFAIRQSETILAQLVKRLTSPITLQSRTNSLGKANRLSAQFGRIPSIAYRT